MTRECTLCAEGGGWRLQELPRVGGIVISLSMCSSHQSLANHTSALTLLTHRLRLVWGDFQQGSPVPFTPELSTIPQKTQGKKCGKTKQVL